MLTATRLLAAEPEFAAADYEFVRIIADAQTRPAWKDAKTIADQMIVLRKICVSERKVVSSPPLSVLREL